jgi:hypothetical protein
MPIDQMHLPITANKEVGIVTSVASLTGSVIKFRFNADGVQDVRRGV